MPPFLFLSMFLHVNTTFHVSLFFSFFLLGAYMMTVGAMILRSDDMRIRHDTKGGRIEYRG